MNPDKFPVFITSRHVPAAILTGVLIAAVIVAALYWYFGTEEGSAVRATGSNPAMGTGQVVFGLATVIIGVALFRRLSFVKGTTAVIVGSILYKLCIAVALDLGLPPNMMKLITAVLFLLVLVASGRKGEEIIHAAGQS